MTTVTLGTPVTIAGKPVTEIALREPRSGELRGLNLTNLLQGSVATMITLIPRISEPALSEAQVAALRPVDLARLFGGVVGFFTDGETTTDQGPTDLPPEA